MPRHPPGRVERVDRVSGRGSPALAGSLPYHHHLREGKRTGKRTKRAGWQTGEAPPCCWSLSIGGEVWRRLRPEADEVTALPLVLVAGAMVAKW